MENQGHNGKSKKHGSVCAVYDMRLHADRCESGDLIEWLKRNCKRYAFQKERSDSGYLHWQIRFSLLKKRYRNAVISLLPEHLRPDVISEYLEPTTNIEHCRTFFYALKEDTRIEGPFVDPIHEKKLGLGDVYMPRQYKIKDLYPWQQQIKDSADEFDFRGIDVLCSAGGNDGKTTIAALCELLGYGIDMPMLNDYKEIVSLACNICMDQELRTPRMFFFDMPRAMKKNKLNEFYSAIEQIKKGKLYDIRYHYKSWWIDSPRVWIFCNEKPDPALLSRDRWRIWQIDKETRKLVRVDPDHDNAE
jgi:hypothetical protein